MIPSRISVGVSSFRMSSLVCNGLWLLAPSVAGCALSGLASTGQCTIPDVADRVIPSGRNEWANDPGGRASLSLRSSSSTKRPARPAPGLSSGSTASSSAACPAPAAPSLSFGLRRSSTGELARRRLALSGLTLAQVHAITWSYYRYVIDATTLGIEMQRVTVT